VIDPILAVLIGLWVLPRTWVLMREAINVLLEGVPKGIQVEAVRARLCAHEGVRDVHDLHVWALASSTPALTAHVVIADGVDADGLRRQLGSALHEDFDIDHVTLQIEAEHCGDDCADGSASASHGQHDHDHDHAAHGHAHARVHEPRRSGPDAQGHHGHPHP
jgi:cobalt-zinc-cadmium efflux system protein